jgi:ATP-binding cassette, subfamily B, bacterial PglK
LKNYTKETLYIIGDEFRKLPWFIILFLGSSVLELLGLGLIGPFLALIVNDGDLKGDLGEIIQMIGIFPSDHKNLMIALGVLLFIIFLLKALYAIGINFFIIRFSHSQQVRLRTLLMNSYQSLPYKEHILRNSSEYIYSIQMLTSQFAGNVVMNLLRTSGDAIVGLVIIVLLALINLKVLLILITLLGLSVFGYDYLFKKNIQNFGAKTNIATTKMLQSIHEGIEGIKEIRILGKEKYFYNKVREEAEQFAFYQLRMEVLSTAPRFLLELLLVSFFVCIILVFLMLDQEPKALLPTLGVFGAASLRLLPTANVFTTSLSKLRFARDGVSKLFQDIKYTEQTKDRILFNENFSNTHFNSLKLKQVCFNYDGIEVVLKNIDLEIYKGESIGIVGTSGAGKTTLIDVLLGLLEPQGGKILFNELPLLENVSEWRSNVAYLPQEIFLTDNTLKNNIALGISNDEINITHLNKVIKMARLTELLERLPLGLETLLGERGVRLSGGQCQRVALARAFYHERSVIVMDEATSALDHETEKEIVEGIKDLKGMVTTIIIAHRLTTLQHCDRIYKLDNGEIIKSDYNKIKI